MMFRNTLHNRYALLSLLGLSLLMPGCSRWIEMNGVTPLDSAPTAAASGDPALRVPAVLSSMSVSQNGSPVMPSSELEHRVLDTLSNAQLFSRIVYPAYSDLQPADDHVRAKLSVALFPEPHAGAAAWKGIVIGASMFTLTPLLPLEYGFGARMTLELEHADGRTRQYSAAADGTAHYHLFGATHLATDELKARVLAACLNQVRQEIMKDRQFVQAGYLAKHQADGYGDGAVIPTSAPVHRKSGSVTLYRSTAPTP
ncbi:MAG: hypothetical protein U0172_04250 [Nitrospiraceae bacterium]